MGTGRRHSAARQWNEQLLQAIRKDYARPTIHARNLFHISAAMYDAWAAYDPVASGYLYREKATAGDVAAARAEAISFVAYRLLRSRFDTSPGAETAFEECDERLTAFGVDPLGNNPAEFAALIAAEIPVWSEAVGLAGVKSP